MDIIDHIDRALSRLITQYRNSANLKLYISNIISQSQDLEIALSSICSDLYLESAAGEQLDLIGVIVGQPRISIPAESISLFGFAPNVQASPFGSVVDLSLGGRFRSFNEGLFGNRLLTDDEYRAVIRTKIAKNYTDCSPESIISSLKLIFRVDIINLIDGDTAYEVQISKVLSENEKILFIRSNMLPKTAGVSVVYSDYDPDDVFSFLGYPGSGFADENLLGSGGKFASIVV